VQAVVLVGGLGTRLRPLTETIPKQLLPVAGIPMIECVLGALARHDVDRAVLSMGYLPDPFVEAYPDHRIAGISVEFAVEPHPLDTAGAIAFAARAGDVDSTFLAVNGDVLTDLDVSALVAQHRSCGAEATVALKAVEDPSRFGVVVTDQSSLVTEWVEKPAAGEAPSNHINAGTYVLEPSVLDRIASDRPVSIERDVFPTMVVDRCLYALLDTSYWLDAGTPSAYLRANADVLDGTRDVPRAGELRDGSLYLDGASIATTASVTRSVVGRGVEIHDEATICDSVILDGAVVARGANVTDSIVGPGAVVGAGAKVSAHCLLAQGARVPERATLSGTGANA
jgi:mannose-1-phosphate guanylyltransferase